MRFEWTTKTRKILKIWFCVPWIEDGERRKDSEFSRAEERTSRSREGRYVGVRSECVKVLYVNNRNCVKNPEA